MHHVLRSVIKWVVSLAHWSIGCEEMALIVSTSIFIASGVESSCACTLKHFQRSRYFGAKISTFTSVRRIVV